MAYCKRIIHAAVKVNGFESNLCIGAIYFAGMTIFVHVSKLKYRS